MIKRNKISHVKIHNLGILADVVLLSDQYSHVDIQTNSIIVSVVLIYTTIY